MPDWLTFDEETNCLKVSPSVDEDDVGIHVVEIQIKVDDYSDSEFYYRHTIEIFSTEDE